MGVHLIQALLRVICLPRLIELKRAGLILVIVLLIIPSLVSKFIICIIILTWILLVVLPVCIICRSSLLMLLRRLLDLALLLRYDGIAISIRLSIRLILVYLRKLSSMILSVRRRYGNLRRILEIVELTCPPFSEHLSLNLTARIANCANRIYFHRRLLKLVSNLLWLA